MRIWPLVFVFALAGCSSAPPEPTEPPTATPEQVASVIAEYETDWRETTEGAGSCRFLWSFPSGSIADEIEGMSCYLVEQTIGSTSVIAVRNLDALDIPDSMIDLVVETRIALTAISDVDLPAVCGTEEVPANETTCNTALGSRMQAYLTLEGVLDSWGPTFERSIDTARAATVTA
jgi:hypothetical protein